MNIQEVRAKFPQYSDMSDQQLADALHGKFYADMPKDEFYSKIGLKDERSGGVVAEGVKGLLRGAGKTAEIIPQGLTAMLPPGVREAARAGLEMIAAPSKTLVKADPKTETERMVATGSEIAGGVLAGGPSGTVGQTVRNALLPAVGGVIGEQIGGETGKTIGALAPTAAQLAVAPISNAIAKRVAPNLETFRQAGTTPTVGQATESSFIRGLENLIAKFPGGVGLMRNFANKQQAALGASRTGVAPDVAGRAVEKGVQGFLERSKQTWQKLDDAVAAKIPKGTGFTPSNTTQALDDLTTPVAGAERTTGAMVNPKLAEIKTNLAADLQANNGVLPFEAMRSLRSRVGAMLDDALVSGIPGGELKKLYGALSKDMEAAAQKAGAGAEFARQNTFYRARMDRIEGVLERVIGKSSQPEDIFKRLMPTDPDQANKVRAVMRSLTPEERRVVTEATVNRLGRATPGKQDELGEVFSSETFLTNWNKLSEGAKAQLFPNHSQRQHIQAIAKVSNNLREGSKIFANTSGTAGAAAPYGLSVLVGFGELGVVGGLIAAANIGARMLTNQRVVEWLAKTPNIRPDNMAPHLARLGIIYNQTSDEGLKRELEQYMASISK